MATRFIIRMPRGRFACRARPTLEVLETRDAPACSVGVIVNPPQLRVLCDAAVDRVTLDHAGTNTLVTANGSPTTWADSRFNTILVNTGAGDDIVTLLAAVRSVTVDTGAGGRNTLDVGNAAGLQAILQPLDVRSTGGLVALDLDDGPNRNPRTAALSARILSGLGPAAVLLPASQLASLAIHGGSGNNVFTIQDIPSAVTALFTGAGQDLVRVYATAAGGALTVDGEAGNDDFYLGSTANSLATLHGPVSLRGQGGTDRAFAADQGTTAGQNYTLDDVSLRRPGMAALSYQSLESLELHGSAGANTFTVVATARGTQTRLLGDRGNDAFYVGTLTSSLDNLQGALHLSGGLGLNNMTLIDLAATSSQSYTIDTSTIDRTGMQIITLDGISIWLLIATTGDDQARILSMTGSTQVTLDMGPGNDLLTGPDSASTWSFTGLNTGTLNGSLTFVAVENLTGGSAGDTFHFGNGMSGEGLSGTLSGGQGTNAVSYANYTTNVEVNLTLQKATGVAGSVFSIQNATGGSGDDVLVGNNEANQLNGNGGRDFLIAGGDDYVSLNADLLNGGTGEDILIAGWTAFDYYADSLAYLRDQWAGPGTFADRTAFLSQFLLPGWSVFSNYCGNTLLGGADDDWFFSNTNLVPDQHPDITPFEQSVRVEIY